MVRYFAAFGAVLLAALIVYANALNRVEPVEATQQQDKKSEYAGIKVEDKSPKRKDKLVLSDDQWRERLTAEQYRILRKRGTEAAFCSPWLDNKKKGTYSCAACGLQLFKTDAKFVSGTGWPSFFQPINRKDIWLKTDMSFNMRRLEVLCSRCDSHLGHLFPDGPEDKTGLRYCINGESLKFKQKKS
ncbi:MAG: peptide-methionine (R)-S-oxide reductase MsrB [Armatimonadetes bacterium]|nr:peptide-methionine (R)-S-oxide reductase MsrB [Armatimonadota bacterium]